MTDAAYFQQDQTYNVGLTATYHYGALSALDYMITVTESVTGSVVDGQFTVTLAGIGGVTMTESDYGYWTSSVIHVTGVSDALTLSIVPNAGAMGLSNVSFIIQATPAVV